MGVWGKVRPGRGLCGDGTLARPASAARLFAGTSPAAVAGSRASLGRRARVPSPQERPNFVVCGATLPFIPNRFSLAPGINPLHRVIESVEQAVANHRVHLCL